MQVDGNGYGPSYRVEYSTNGSSWSILGDESIPTWYGVAPTYPNTGFGAPNSSTTVTFDSWTHVELELCDLANEPCVMFRISAYDYFNQNSGDSAYFAFDNFEITSDTSIDVAINAFYPTNTTRCNGFRTNERPRIIIQNNSCQPTEVPIRFEVSGPVNATFLDTTPTVNPYSCYSYNLDTTLDLSAIGDYDFQVNLEQPFDTLATNDTLRESRSNAKLTLPYFEDFNSDDGNWYDNTRRCEQRFSWGNLPYLDGPEGEGSSWYYTLDNGGNQFGRAEVESPVFDFTGQVNPTMSFDMKMQVDGNGYGPSYRVEYSTNGSSWTLLGDESISTWYGVAPTYPNVGFGAPNSSTTVTIDDWTHVQLDLCELADEPCVMFRVRAYDYFNQNSGDSAYFAFDNFRITSDTETDFELLSFFPTNTTRCNGFRTNERPRLILTNHTCRPAEVPIRFTVSGPVNVTYLDTTPTVQPGQCYSYNLDTTLDLSTIGTYSFTATLEEATDTMPGNDSMSEVRNNAKLTLPYFEDFNTDDGNWYDNTRRCEQRFSWGNLPYLDGPEGEGSSWYYTLDNGGNQFGRAEVESPVFDFTGQVNPTMSFDMKMQVDGNGYGPSYRVEYSTNGYSWTLLGDESISTWYGVAPTYPNVGFGAPNSSTTVTLDDWTHVQLDLCELADEPCVMFRVRAYDYFNQNSGDSAYFAFDNFRITSDTETDFELLSFYPVNTMRCSGLRTNERPRIIVTNNTCRPAEIPLRFDVSGPVNVTYLDTTPTVQPGQCYSYNLDTTLNLSPQGDYNFSLQLEEPTDTMPGNDAMTEFRSSVPVIPPYTEDFNADDGNWYANGRRCEQRFLWGNVPYLNGPDGEGSSWYYELDNGGNQFGRAYVESPLFDFTTMSSPIIAFDFKMQVDGNGYGPSYRVEYTTNGTSWQLLGDETYETWYGIAPTYPNVGFGSPNSSTTVTIDDWTRARYLACELAGEPCVQFRIRAYDYFNQNSGDSAYFAFDNFEIINREPEVEVLSIVNPDGDNPDGCLLDANKIVRLELRNNGCNPASDIPVVFEASNAVSETILDTFPGPLAPGATVEFALDSTFDMTVVGVYDFVAYTDVTTDPIPENDTAFKTVNVTGAIVSTYPYNEDFNTDNGGWYPDSTHHPNRYFEHGAVSFLGGPQGYGDSWYTVVNNNGYSDFYVESPVFDFSALTNPVLSVDIKAEMRSYYGTNVHVDYSTDGGATWTLLGDESTPNWYGEFPAYSSYTGWGPTNNSVQSLPDWTHMTQSLCPLAGETCVVLRFYADRRMYNGQMDFAFDNVRISDAPDFALTQVIQPTDFENCWTDGKVPVELELYSYMCADTGNIPVVVEVDGPGGPQTLSESMPAPITSEALHTYLFTDSIDAATPGTYDFTAYINLPTDADNLNDTLTWSITRDHIVVSSFPYTEDFNSGAGNWIADSAYHPNRYFELGAVSFLGGPQGYGDSWYTVVNNNGYGDFSVESPVFDFSDLTNPVLSMDIKAEMRSYYGTNVHVEYSTNGGATWATLGDESTPNWYGEFPAYSSYTGWGPTNNSVQSLPDWTHMTQSLCPLAGESCVMFRVLADRRMYNGQMDLPSTMSASSMLRTLRSRKSFSRQTSKIAGPTAWFPWNWSCTATCVPTPPVYRWSWKSTGRWARRP